MALALPYNYTYTMKYSTCLGRGYEWACTTPWNISNKCDIVSGCEFRKATLKWPTVNDLNYGVSLQNYSYICS